MSKQDLKSPKENSNSPYFLDNHRNVISVIWPHGGWIIWNWIYTSWNHLTDDERNVVKQAEASFYSKE